jgi:hypothetical protein
MRHSPLQRLRCAVLYDILTSALAGIRRRRTHLLLQLAQLPVPPTPLPVSAASSPPLTVRPLTSMPLQAPQSAPAQGFSRQSAAAHATITGLPAAAAQQHVGSGELVQAAGVREAGRVSYGGGIMGQVGHAVGNASAACDPAAHAGLSAGVAASPSAPLPSVSGLSDPGLLSLQASPLVGGGAGSGECRPTGACGHRGRAVRPGVAEGDDGLRHSALHYTPPDERVEEAAAMAELQSLLARERCVCWGQEQGADCARTLQASRKHCGCEHCP